MRSSKVARAAARRKTRPSPPARGDARAAGFESGGVEHNGLKSLKRELGGAEFARVRIGVGRPDSTDPEIVAGHVLGRWRQPREEVAALVARAADAAERNVAGAPSV